MNRAASILILTVGIGSGLYRAFAQPPAPGANPAPAQPAAAVQPASPPVQPQAPTQQPPPHSPTQPAAAAPGSGSAPSAASGASSAPGSHPPGLPGSAPSSPDLSQAGQSITVKSEIKKTNDEARAGIQDYLKFRDPFKQPETQKSTNEQLTDLEKYAVSEFKLTGVMTGPKKMRAMILAPDGKTHFVSEKMKIGNKNGIIAKITTKSLVVKEKLVNALGEEELIETEMSMAPDASAKK